MPEPEKEETKKVEQAPDLDEDDDAILDSIWDKIGKEDQSEERKED